MSRHAHHGSGYQLRCRTVFPCAFIHHKTTRRLVIFHSVKRPTAGSHIRFHFLNGSIEPFDFIRIIVEALADPIDKLKPCIFNLHLCMMEICINTEFS